MKEKIDSFTLDKWAAKDGNPIQRITQHVYSGIPYEERFRYYFHDQEAIDKAHEAMCKAYDEYLGKKHKLMAKRK